MLHFFNMLIFNHCSNPRIVKQIIRGRSGLGISIETLADELLDEYTVVVIFEVAIKRPEIEGLIQDCLKCCTFRIDIASEWYHCCEYNVHDHS